MKGPGIDPGARFTRVLSILAVLSVVVGCDRERIHAHANPEAEGLTVCPAAGGPHRQGGAKQ
jgi:hypothetical protein